MLRYLLFLVLIFTIHLNTFAQDKSTKEEKKKIRKLNARPRRASIMSAVLPGSGQIYNKSVWKAPIVWAGLGITGFLYVQNSTFFKDFKREYGYMSDADASTISNTTINGYHTFGRSADQLAKERDTYRYYRDLDMMIFLGIYALNIIDANVDAHLKGFDINDNLSLRVKPLLYANINRQFTTGLTLNFRFKK